MRPPDPHRMGWIGLPFVEGGRDRPAVDCWGCVVLVYREAFGLELPLYDTTPTADPDACGAMIGSRSMAEWLSVPAGLERFGDVAVVERMGVPCHVGLVVGPALLLHADQGRTSAVVPYPSPFLRGRVAAVFRHPAIPGT